MITGLLAAVSILFAPLTKSESYKPVTIYQPYMEPVIPSKIEESVILSKILGKHQVKCTDYNGSVPHVSSIANGSFTEKGRKEQLYTVHFVDCSSAHYNNYGKTRVYIVRNGKIVLDADSEGVVIKVIDVNDDGRDEWVVKTGFCNQGRCVESAQINGLCGTQITDYYKFDTVYDSNCGGIDSVKMVKYQVVIFYFDPQWPAPAVVPLPKTKKCDPRD